MKLLLSILTFIFIFTNVNAENKTTHFQLQKGDLLFQDLNCGDFCNNIDKVTHGIHHTFMSHVGMVVNTQSDDPLIIEAASQGVIETPLSHFLQRSVDEQGRPRVVVGRLKKPFRALIVPALNDAKHFLGYPYNDSFIANGHSFYCSELIDEAFRLANHGKRIFHQHPMNFTDPKTGKIFPFWQAYFLQLKIDPPQGLPGTNPGSMSREKVIHIVHWYGKLREAYVTEQI